MNREEKAAAVSELSESLKEADAIFAVDYRGISVTGAAELRTKLAEADAVFKVVKNRLAKRAAADVGPAELEELLSGPTALTLVKGDAVIAAKAISTFAREHEILEYKGGVMDGEALDAERFAAIARLPGRDALHGQLVGIAASPLTGLARGLGSMLSGLAVALGQIAEQGLVSGEAPAAEDAEPAAEPAEQPAVEGNGSEQATEPAEGGGEEEATEPVEGDEQTSDAEQADGGEEAPAAEAEASDEGSAEAEASESPESEEEESG